jgi:aminoglycoside phosphotransferase (APT) family kinase protein
LRFEAEREEVLAKYEAWLRERLETDTPQRREIERLADYAEDLVLACWCAPKLCHGDVVKRVIEEILDNRRRDARG